MSRNISMNVGHYALILSLTAVLLMMELPNALFEPTWGSVIRVILMLALMVILCLSHPRFQRGSRLEKINQQG